MEKIEGIDLSELVNDATKDIIEERKRTITAQIRLIVSKINWFKLDIKQAERLIKKREEGIQKGYKKLEQLKNGDWSVLEEKQGKQEKEDDDEVQD